MNNQTEIERDDNDHREDIELTILDGKSTKPIEKPIKINYACICVFAFLLGTDFAVIIPTLWERLKSMNSSGPFMGLIISSYSATGVISGLVMGYMSDKVNKTKYFFLYQYFLHSVVISFILRA